MRNKEENATHITELLLIFKISTEAILLGWCYFPSVWTENSEIQHLMSVGRKSSVEFPYFLSVRTFIHQMATHANHIIVPTSSNNQSNLTDPNPNHKP